jgi:hypothetical protein
MIGSRRFQNGSLTLVKNLTKSDTWFLRFDEEVGDKRVYRRKRIGTVRDFPHRRDAEKGGFGSSRKHQQRSQFAGDGERPLSPLPKVRAYAGSQALPRLKIISPYRSVTSRLAGERTNLAR